MCTLTGGIEQGNIAGPAAPLGGGRSDCPLVLELLLGRLAPTQKTIFLGPTKISLKIQLEIQKLGV